MGWVLFIIACVLLVLCRVTTENEGKMRDRQFENERGMWEEMSKREFKETAKLRWELDLLRKAMAEKQGQSTQKRPRFGEIFEES